MVFGSIILWPNRLGYFLKIYKHRPFLFRIHRFIGMFTAICLTNIRWLCHTAGTKVYEKLSIIPSLKIGIFTTMVLTTYMKKPISIRKEFASRRARFSDGSVMPARQLLILKKTKTGFLLIILLAKLMSQLARSARHH